MAIHSISSLAPRAKPLPAKALLAGSLLGLKNFLYSSLIRGQSFISESIQVHLNMSSIDPPIFSNLFLILVSVWRVSCTMPPATREPSANVPISPDKYIIPFTIVASENG